MRLLVIDVGNTSTAIGDWSNGRTSNVAHIDGDVRQVIDEIDSRIAELPGGRAIGGGRYQAVGFASVVPKKDARILAAIRKTRLKVVRINDQSFLDFADKRGLFLDYPNTGEIGADRFADAAGAFTLFGSGVLTMDFGTAMTAAIITRDGVWRGGVIAPGFPLMRDYLFERTAKLPRLEIGGRVPKIGRSTEEAMRFGAIVGARGMVREIVAELTKNFKEDFRLVATGGYARWVLKDSGLDFKIVPNLTLTGIGLICASSL